MALFPARAGVQTTVRIFFYASITAGTYFFERRDIDDKGIQFGKSFFIEIIVDIS